MQHDPSRAPSLAPGTVFMVSLDVTELERSAAFYGELGGMEVVARYREGLAFESWVLAAKGGGGIGEDGGSGAGMAGVSLHLRKSFGKPVSGSVVGGFRGLTIGYWSRSEMEKRLGRLGGRVRWVTPEASRGEASGGALELLDPDGYVVRLCPVLVENSTA